MDFKIACPKVVFDQDKNRVPKTSPTMYMLGGVRNKDPGIASPACFLEPNSKEYPDEESLDYAWQVFSLTTFFIGVGMIFVAGGMISLEFDEDVDEGKEEDEDEIDGSEDCRFDEDEDDEESGENDEDKEDDDMLVDDDPVDALVGGKRREPDHNEGGNFGDGDGANDSGDNNGSGSDEGNDESGDSNGGDANDNGGDGNDNGDGNNDNNDDNDKTDDIEDSEDDDEDDDDDLPDELDLNDDELEDLITAGEQFLTDGNMYLDNIASAIDTLGLEDDDDGVETADFDFRYGGGEDSENADEVDGFVSGTFGTTGEATGGASCRDGTGAGKAKGGNENTQAKKTPGGSSSGTNAEADDDAATCVASGIRNHPSNIQSGAVSDDGTTMRYRGNNPQGGATATAGVGARYRRFSGQGGATHAAKDCPNRRQRPGLNYVDIDPNAVIREGALVIFKMLCMFFVMLWMMIQFWFPMPQHQGPKQLQDSYKE